MSENKRKIESSSNNEQLSTHQRIKKQRDEKISNHIKNVQEIDEKIQENHLTATNKFNFELYLDNEEKDTEKHDIETVKITLLDESLYSNELSEDITIMKVELTNKSYELQFERILLKADIEVLQNIEEGGEHNWNNHETHKKFVTKIQKQIVR